MSKWIEELKALGAEGEQLARRPDEDRLRHSVRRRRAVRTAVPIGLAGVLVVVLAVVIVPQLLPQPVTTQPAAPVERCGYTVAEAAQQTFGVSEVFAPGDGPVDLVIDGNRVQELERPVAMAGRVAHAASGVETFSVVPDVTGSFAAAWLVVGGDVVGTMTLEHATEPERAVAPDSPLVVDSAWTPLDCAGEPIGPGEYEVVAAVAVAPGDDPAAEPSAVVLSKPYQVRLDEPDRFGELGACGTDWPGEGIIEQTDGYALGLRLGTGDGPRIQVNNGVRAVMVDVTVTNAGDQQLKGITGIPEGAIVKDGKVIGTTGPSLALGIDASLAPDESRSYADGGALLTHCAEGTPLPKGTYELYAVMEFFLDEPTGQDGPQGNRTDVTAVGGPWKFRVP